MSTFMSSTVLMTAMYLGLMLGPIFLVIHVFRFKSRHKKSPLNINLLRSPGQTLSAKLEDLNIDLIGNLLMIPITALALLGTFLLHKLSYPDTNATIVAIELLLAGIGVTAYVTWKSYGRITDRNILRLGYECEVFVGQGLENLRYSGFKVYHDFPVKDFQKEFNIDHIAIGPTGVFAIETKGRSKQIKAEKENWKVKYDGVSLTFPSWKETEPVDQAKRNAQWLSAWIESSTGESQSVTPILAIPGWWIENLKPGKVKVYNGKNPDFMTKGQRVLTDARIKAISHQVEQKCRDVKAESYKKKANTDSN